MNITAKILAILYFLHLQKLCTLSKPNRLSCEEVNKELIAMGVIIENTPGDSTSQDSNICSRSYGNQDCCSQAVRNELLKRSAEEVNLGYRSYIIFCKKEAKNLSKNLKYFIDYKFAAVSGTLTDLKCRNRLADGPPRFYLECLRNGRELVSEVMDSFFRSTSMHNDTFDGAAAFLFNLVLSLRMAGESSQNVSSCSWILDKAISGEVSQVLRILRSLSGTHVCGHASRWSTVGRRGHLTVWEFMKRTKMTGRVLNLIRSVVHLMETTKTLEYLHWLLEQLSSFDLGSAGCDRVLMQMRHCSLCAGYPLVHPCPSFCEVSLARCLRPINKLQSSWTSLINTLHDQLQAWSNPTNPMIRNIELYAPQAILEFHRVIMKAVLDAAPQECRNDVSSGSAKRDGWLDLAVTVERKRSTTPVSTQTQFMRISHKLQSLKRLWISAPSKICRESPHLSSSSSSSSIASSHVCWNGTAIGPYVDGTYFDWGSDNVNNEASMQWPSQWPRSSEELSLNRMSTRNEQVADAVSEASKSLMIFNCRLKQAFPATDWERKNGTNKPVTASDQHNNTQSAADETQFHPRNPTRLERKTGFSGLKYQGGWHQIPKLPTRGSIHSRNAENAGSSMVSSTLHMLISLLVGVLCI
ncbi:Glypican-1 [Echinococcus granulosus]|nr:Glypican-1 [Echinococcus granulosus]